MVRLVAKTSRRVGSALSGILMFCVGEGRVQEVMDSDSSGHCLWTTGSQSQPAFWTVVSKGSSVFYVGLWFQLLSSWLRKTQRCLDSSWFNSDHCFWWFEAFRMMVTMEYAVQEDHLIHEWSLLSQKHDSGDRIPTVLGAAACLPGAEAVVGRVYRLPFGGHADDRCVRMYFTGRCLDSCQNGSRGGTAIDLFQESAVCLLTKGILVALLCLCVVCTIVAGSLKHWFTGLSQ